MEYKCKRHRRYALKRKPTSNCEACWYLWACKNWFACIQPYVQERIKDLC